MKRREKKGPEVDGGMNPCCAHVCVCVLLTNDPRCGFLGVSFFGLSILQSGLPRPSLSAPPSKPRTHTHTHTAYTQKQPRTSAWLCGPLPCRPARSGS